jgi:hypothetical protein
MSMSEACWNVDGALGEAPLSSERYALVLQCQITLTTTSHSSDKKLTKSAQSCFRNGRLAHDTLMLRGTKQHVEQSSGHAPEHSEATASSLDVHQWLRS